MLTRGTWILVLGLALASCGDDSTGKSPAALVGLGDAGVLCASGGVLITTGVDIDEDGVLDEEEIRGSQAICNGSDGKDGVSSLLLVEDEPAGGHCGLGGKAVHLGLDTDGDRLLDAEEVQTTTYLCDASPGSVGLVNMQQLFDRAIPFNVTYPTPYPDSPPELIYASATLSRDFTDPATMTVYPAGTQVKAQASSPSLTGFTANALTIDNKTIAGAYVHLFYAAFEFAD